MKIRLIDNQIHKVLHSVTSEMLLESKRAQTNINRSVQLLTDYINNNNQENIVIEDISVFVDIIFNTFFLTRMYGSNKQFQDFPVINLLPLLSLKLYERYGLAINHYYELDIDDTVLKSIANMIRTLTKFNTVNKGDGNYVNIQTFIQDNKDKKLEDIIEPYIYQGADSSVGYELIGPLTYDEAVEYGNLSYSMGKICYTQDEDTWDKYTNYDVCSVYVLLRKDLANILVDQSNDEPEVHTQGKLIPNCPNYNGYDDYGLSMLFVIVDKRTGNLRTVNTRWNHGRGHTQYWGSVDNALDKPHLEEVIGSDVFDELIHKDNIHSFQDLILQGVPIVELFDDVFDEVYQEYCIVKYENKYNILIYDNDLNNYRIFYKPDDYTQWFNNVKSLNNDYFKVLLNNNLYIVNISEQEPTLYTYQPQLLLDEGIYYEDVFDYCYTIYNDNYCGLVTYQNKHKYNVYNKENNQIIYQPNNIENWFDIHQIISGEYHLFIHNDKNTFNIWDTHNNRFLLENELPLDFEFIDNLTITDDTGYFLVQKKLNGEFKRNILDTKNGRYIYQQPIEYWFNHISPVIEMDGFFYVMFEINNEKKYNIYNINKPQPEMVWKQNLENWFNSIYYYDDNLFTVGKHNTSPYKILYNCLTIDGKLLLPEWLIWDDYYKVDIEDYLPNNNTQQTLNEIINRLVRNYLKQ